MDLNLALRALREHKTLFIVSSVIALAFLFFGPTEKSFAPVYSSYAKILLTPPTVVAYSNQQAGTPVVQSWFTDETTLQELVGSEELLNRVAVRLQLREPWNSFRERINVNFLSKQTHQVTLFQIQVVAARPEAAQQQTLVLVEEFIKYVQELSAREYASTRRFLVDLVAEANSQLKVAQQNVLKAKNPAMSTDGVDVQARRMTDLQSQRAEVAQKLSSLKAELSGLQMATSSDIPPWAILEQKHSGLESMQDNLAKERAALDELERNYLPNTEEVRTQRARVATAETIYRREMSRAVSSMLKSREGQVMALEASLESLDKELERIALQQPTVADRLQNAQRERQLGVWQENYLNLTRRLYEAKVNEQMSKRQGAFSILERPQPGSMVIRPGTKNRPTWQRYLLGIPFCFAFGAGVVLLQEYMRSSMRMQPKIEEALELPIMGTIPRLPRDLSARWERLKQGSSPDELEVAPELLD